MTLEEMKKVYTKRNIFRMAHKLASGYEGDYSARMSMALKEVYVAIANKKAELQAQQEMEKVQRDLRVLFSSQIVDDILSLKSNTYGIKETLKALGFTYRPTRRDWFIQSNNIVEIAKQVIAA